MSGCRDPLEFNAKEPWRPKAVTEDPEEEDEEDSDEAKDSFSLEEVLRLGGTKVPARRLWGRGMRTAAGNVGPAAQPPTCSERFPRL